MKLAEIQSELRRQLTEAGAIVVWHDPEARFADTLDELDLPGVTVLREREGELFSLKAALNDRRAEQNRPILLYRARAPHATEDWLADVEAMASAFSADFSSLQLRELNAPDTPQMRGTLQARKRFLGKKSNLKRLMKLQDAYESPHQLDLGIMAVALWAEEPKPESVVRAYLMLAYAKDGATAREALDGADVSDSFRAALHAWTGFAGDIDRADDALRHVLLAALAHELPAGTAISCMAEADEVAERQAAFCHSVADSWHRSQQRESLFSACQQVENAEDVRRALGQLPDEALLCADTLPAIDALILRHLFSRVADNPGEADDVLAVAAARRAGAWYGRFAPYYEGIVVAARMQRFHRDRIGNLARGDAVDIWSSYTGELYLMDTWYRNLHAALTRAIRSGEYGLDEEFRRCAGAMERLYKGWYLQELSRRWTGAIEADLGGTGQIGGIPRQLDFDIAEVEPIVHAKKRAWVIVSDALRYEVAAELQDILERETKGICELGAMQATFPSITKCGMAALLPGGTYALAERPRGAREHGMAVSVNGLEATSTEQRQRAIGSLYPDGIAVTYDAFVNGMGREERRALVDSAPVVYLYHNAIDALGDKAITERKVFAACDDALGELIACVKLLVREFSASRIVITADHGFLYSDEPLAETDRLSLSDVDGTVVEAGKRYAIARAGASSEPMLSVALPASRNADGVESLVGFAPRECVRIRRAGGGENFVHGGISLQELCVPVLRFVNKRAGTKGYLESQAARIALVSPLSTIANATFTLELLQEQPVGGKILPTVYDVFAGSAPDAPVTDAARVVADRTETDAAARTSRVTLSLRADAETSEQTTYHLYARDTQSGGVSVLRDVTICVARNDSSPWTW